MAQRRNKVVRFGLHQAAHDRAALEVEKGYKWPSIGDLAREALLEKLERLRLDGEEQLGDIAS